jgi:hypothetical protein
MNASRTLNPRNDSAQWNNIKTIKPAVNGRIRVQIIFCGEMTLDYKDGVLYWENGEPVSDLLYVWWKW